MHLVRETTGQSWIDSKEIFHLITITCCNDNKLSTVVLHTFHQRINSLPTVWIILCRQCIGLVYKQDTAHRLITHIINYLGSFTHIFTYKSSTTGFYDSAGWKNLHRLKDLTHFTSNRSFTSTRITSKNKIHGHLLNFTGTHCCTLFHKHTLNSQTTNHILDRKHTNKVIEFVEYLIKRTNLFALSNSQISYCDAIHIFTVEVWIVHLSHQSLALFFYCLVKNTTRLSSITKILVTTQIQLFKLAMNSIACFLIYRKLLTIGKVDEDLRQLIRSVVLEMNSLCKTTLQSRVRINKVMHIVGISGNDADKLSSIIFQALQQGINSLRAKAILIVRLERISLVDEEDTTHR